MENYKCFISDDTKELMKKDFLKKVKELKDHLKELKESDLLTKYDLEILVNKYTNVVDKWYMNYCAAIGRTDGCAGDEEITRAASSTYFRSKLL